MYLRNRIIIIIVMVAILLLVGLNLVLTRQKILLTEEKHNILSKRPNSSYKLSYHPAQAFPRIIYQTFHNKSLIPQKVYDQFKKFAPNYKHVIWNDTECFTFIKKHFGKDVARRFTELQGCFKADLFRYCVLYINGGIYMDIKTELIRPVDECFPNRAKSYLILSSNYVYNIPIEIVYQGILACPAGHPLMLYLIDFIMRHDPVYYLRYVKDCCDQFYKYFFTDDNVVLYKEICVNDGTTCNGLDRYGLCCFVFDQNDNKMFKVRFNDYPWKKQ